MSALPQDSAAAWLSDETLALPLWMFSPGNRLGVLSERRRRGILQDDPEPIGDPDYT